jgi:hypothetical protein
MVGQARKLRQETRLDREALRVCASVPMLMYPSKPAAAQGNDNYLEDASMKRFFAYDPNGGGIEFFDTAKEAKEYAHNAFDEEQSVGADSGWNEDVTRLCWGEIKEVVVEVGRRKDASGKFDVIIDYALRSPKRKIK